MESTQNWQVIESNWVFLLHPALTTLLTATHQGRETITPIAWLMPMSGNPPLVAMAIKSTRFGYELLRDSGEFGLSLPFYRDAARVWACGTTSGRDRDKFSLTGYTRLAGEKIQTSLIAESAALLECSVEEDRPTGDHQLVIGRVLLARARPELYDGEFKAGFDACLHLRKNHFLPPDWTVRQA